MTRAPPKHTMIFFQHILTDVIWETERIEISRLFGRFFNSLKINLQN